MLSFFVIQCQTNPPTTPDTNINNGRISVSSNVDGASIFLDDELTGQVTPDTITSTIGNHEIRLEKDGYYSASSEVQVNANSTENIYINMESIIVQKVVLLEDFANVSCTPCVISNQIIEKLANETFGETRLVVVKFPTNFPSPVDPFYLASSQACDTRLEFYNPIFIAPTVIIDGINRPTATDEESVVSAINERLHVESPFELTVTDIIVNNRLSVSIFVKCLNADAVNYENLVLHTVLTETDITFDSPPGSNGETSFYNVMRKMLPSSDGEIVTPLGNREERQYIWNTETSNNWQKDNLHVVVFLQDRVTKNIYQSAVSD